MKPLRLLLILIGLGCGAFVLSLWFVVPTWIRSLQNVNAPMPSSIATAIALSNIARTPIGIFFIMNAFGLYCGVLIWSFVAKRNG